MIPFFGNPFNDDPDVYAKSSPIAFIKKAKTPTLVIVGDSDGECPTRSPTNSGTRSKTLGVKRSWSVYETRGPSLRQTRDQRDRIRALSPV